MSRRWFIKLDTIPIFLCTATCIQIPSTNNNVVGPHDPVRFRPNALVGTRTTLGHGLEEGAAKLRRKPRAGYVSNRSTTGIGTGSTGTVL